MHIVMFQLISVPYGPHLESKILQNAAIETEINIWGREGTQETLPDSKLFSEPQRKTARKFQAVAHSQGGTHCPFPSNFTHRSSYSIHWQRSPAVSGKLKM